MLRLSRNRNSYSGHSRIFLVARTMALSASTWYSWSGSTRLTPHMLIRRFKRTMSFMAYLLSNNGLVSYDGPSSAGDWRSWDDSPLRHGPTPLRRVDAARLV